MNQKEIVQGLMDSIQKGDFEKARTLLSSDFKFSGAVPEPISADAWLGISKSLKKAFPNLDYHFHVESANGDVVKGTAELKGTHTDELDVTSMNMGKIPATQKSFANPREQVTATVRGDKVVSWVVDRTPGGGLTGILGQLGVKTPTK